jgi:transcriptional regulator with GAF, ATPase, and Fis domain
MVDLRQNRQINELEEKLLLRKRLQDITNRIHSAQNMKQILVDLKDGILTLFNVYFLTIYVVDRAKNEIYSMFLSPAEKLNEIRVPISNRSISGYVANTGKIVNISDAYDDRELKTLDKELAFDVSWDKK